MKIIMSCRTESRDYRTDLGFNLIVVVDLKQQTTTKTIKREFEGEDILTEYSVLGFRVDLYFHKYKVAIEVDQFGHWDRNIDYEIKRQKAVKEELGCKFIRINPDEGNFSERKPVTKIYMHIKVNQKIINRQYFEKTVRTGI